MSARKNTLKTSLERQEKIPVIISFISPTGGILDSACLSVSLCVHVSMYMTVSICVQNTSNFVSQTPIAVLLQLYYNFAHTLIIY